MAHQTKIKISKQKAVINKATSTFKITKKKDQTIIYKSELWTMKTVHHHLTNLTNKFQENCQTALIGTAIIGTESNWLFDHAYISRIFWDFFIIIFRTLPKYSNLTWLPWLSWHISNLLNTSKIVQRHVQGDQWITLSKISLTFPGFPWQKSAKFLDYL